MKKYTNSIVQAIMIFLIAVLIIGAINKGVGKQEVVDCLHLQEQSQTINPWNPVTETGFYITKDEDDMCKSHNITINAHVK